MQVVNLLAGVLLSMVLRCRGAGLLRSHRTCERTLDPLLPAFARGVRDLDGQDQYPR
jgi:hypothetical protein